MSTRIGNLKSPSSQEIQDLISSGNDLIKKSEINHKEVRRLINDNRNETSTYQRVSKLATNLGNGIAIGLSLASTVTGSLSNVATGGLSRIFSKFWKKKIIDPIGLPIPRLETAGASARTNQVPLLLTIQKATAIKVEKSWVMFGTGALLMVLGVAGNAVAPGASLILASTGASLMFGGAVEGKF